MTGDASANKAIDPDRCDRAARRGVSLAIHQNSRGAPHFAYILEAVEAGPTPPCPPDAQLQ